MESFHTSSVGLNETSESDLVARAQRGEEGAFAALFEAHKRRVYFLCLRMTGAPDEAEDLTQEAFLRAFRKISTFRGEAAFFTWLHRLAVNVVLMHLRKRRLSQVSLDAADTSSEKPCSGSMELRIAASRVASTASLWTGRLPSFRLAAGLSSSYTMWKGATTVKLRKF